jgi:prepilin-type N-terminal cleavage/methylation domain-containing protein
MSAYTHKNPQAFTPRSFYKRSSSFVGRGRAARAFTLKSAFSEKSAGFTLIEVMIVIMIVGSMAIIMLVSFGSGQTERQLETNAREFVGMVREAQNYALTGKQAVAATDPCRFQVSWSGAVYSMTYWYKDAAGVCNQTSPMVTSTLKDGVTFSNADNFYFTLPHANLSFGSGSKGAILTKQSSFRVACTYSSGLINELAGAACP